MKLISWSASPLRFVLIALAMLAAVVLYVRFVGSRIGGRGGAETPAPTSSRNL